MDRKKSAQRWRGIQASMRDALILFAEFRGPLLWFSAAIIGGGLAYYRLAEAFGEPVNSPAESIYLILTITFLQPPNRDFPLNPILQSFYFFMPILGVILLAQGLTDFGSLLFNRRNRNKEWELAVASMLKNHIILVGLGHLGYRVALKLHEMGETLAVIELNTNADTVKHIRDLGVPVIHEDAARQGTLEAVKIHKARAIILASQNDAMNLQIALKARTLNPDIQVVIRIFDDDFAHALHDQFGFTALSATEMAAPIFAAAAAGADVTHPISVEGQLLSLARLTISARAPFARKTVGFVEDNYHLSVVLLRSGHQTHMHPVDKSPLQAGDVIAVLGGPEQLNKLLNDNGQ